MYKNYYYYFFKMFTITKISQDGNLVYCRGFNRKTGIFRNCFESLQEETGLKPPNLQF